MSFVEDIIAEINADYENHVAADADEDDSQLTSDHEIIADERQQF